MQRLSSLLLTMLLFADTATAQGSSPRWTTIRNDSTVVMDTVAIPSGSDRVGAYIARPNRSGKFPAVILIHANRLTEPYIASATQAMAREGFAVLAIDLFHFAPGNESWHAANMVSRDTVGAIIAREFREDRLLRNIQGAIDHLRAQSFVASGGVALVGFCGGGWSALVASAQLRDIGAVVALYAPVEISDEQQRAPAVLASFIRVPVQYHYALQDQWVPKEGADKFVGTLKSQGTPVEYHVYDAAHGFFAWNRVGVFKESAAELAWSRMIPFLTAHTGQGPSPRPLAPARSTQQNDPRSTQHTKPHH